MSQSNADRRGAATVVAHHTRRTSAKKSKQEIVRSLRYIPRGVYHTLRPDLRNLR
jgi:hypothetical protein